MSGFGTMEDTMFIPMLGRIYVSDRFGMVKMIHLALGD